MLEAKIDTLTECVKELTAAIKANGVRPAANGGGATAQAGTKTAEPMKTKAYEPKHTLDEMKKKCIEVRDAFSPAEAKQMIKDFGKADKLGDVTGMNIDALYDACVAKLEAGAGGGDDL